MKRIFLFIAIMFALSSSMFATATHVSHAAATTSSATTTAASSTWDTTGADFIVCHVSSEYTNAPTITDFYMNTWHVISFTGNVQTGTEQSNIIYAYNATVGASEVITATTAANGYPAFDCDAFSGMDLTSAVLDQNIAANSGSGNSLATGPLTPANAGSVIITGLASEFSSAPSVDSSILPSGTGSYILFHALVGNNYAEAEGYKIQTSAAAINVTWTDDVIHHAVTMAVFNAAPAVCTPSKLVFTAQPSNATTGASLGTVMVAVQDSGSSTCTSNTSNITLSKHSGATWGTISSSSSLTKAAVAGVATWTDLSIDTAGAGTIDAADGALTGATSSSITISASGNNSQANGAFMLMMGH